MKQLTIRNVTADLARALEEEGHRRRESINQTVLDLLKQALGLVPESRYKNGLANLAGTWSREDAAEFERNTAVFEKIDEEMWK
jgi:plasmid stability protein